MLRRGSLPSRRLRRGRAKAAVAHAECMIVRRRDGLPPGDALPDLAARRVPRLALAALGLADATRVELRGARRAARSASSLLPSDACRTLRASARQRSERSVPLSMHLERRRELARVQDALRAALHSSLNHPARRRARLHRVGRVPPSVGTSGPARSPFLRVERRHP